MTLCSHHPLRATASLSHRLRALRRPSTHPAPAQSRALATRLAAPSSPLWRLFQFVAVLPRLTLTRRPFWSAATALLCCFPAQGPSIACVAREPPQRGSDGSPFLSPCPPVLAPPSLSSQRGVSDDRPRPLWPRSMLHVAVGYHPRPLAPPSPGYVRLPIPSSR